ncbi:cryptochrome/photolyase family protein [Occallatibacter savannae]|uniref:cryptochrome/photolyase family protein n=1 Tax=Occallatibacter savannae TaxID=1002691 RepID=UPI000D692D3C|nr:cryptochrome/photolyase family protein [Occallatibacter savannae]
MSRFSELIAPAAPTKADLRERRWIFVPYDRFTDRVGPIAAQDANLTGIVIVESTNKGHRRAYHKKKLVLLISNMRHFALEQAERGVKVVYHFSELSHGQALVQLQRQGKIPQLVCMTPAERELRLDLQQAIGDGLKIKFVEDSTWLSSIEDFVLVYGKYAAGKSYVMDRFYRKMRQQTGILMQNGRPVGKQFSFDAENRKPWRGDPAVPEKLQFPPDEITQEVIDLVASTYGNHFGSIEGFDLPVTQEDCDRMWRHSLAHMLPYFGPYEDAMRDDAPRLFHSQVSALVNLGRLLPAALVRDVEQAASKGKIPLASAEGFIRQLLGWREFMRHIHQQTDGYRLVEAPHEEGKPRSTSRQPLIGAAPAALHASLPLPAAYWGVKSGLHCLDTVVEQVIDEGWSHHITRLMVLSNLATLCGFSARELTDWFWIAYVDAYDWVVETNVLGMGTYADGGVTATKPYVSGAAYINRMSNYCGHCRFDPKQSTGSDSCPFTALYWTFLERNRDVLGNNFRLQMPYRTLDRKPHEELVELRARAEGAVEHLLSFSRPVY